MIEFGGNAMIDEDLKAVGQADIDSQLLLDSIQRTGRTAASPMGVA
ncbi:hypothetical protein [Streptomyces sp. NPDC006368]